MNDKIIIIKGSKDYEVNTEEVTCTCPHFRYRCSHFPKYSMDRLCKHLVQAYEENPQLKPIELKKSEPNENGDGKIRYPRDIFRQYIDMINEAINANKHIIKKYLICGSYRRLKSEISDLDYLIVLEDGVNSPSLFFNYITSIGGIKLWEGDKKGSYKFDGFVQVDFRVISEESFPFASSYFTGSKEENIRLRRIAASMKHSLSEYGLRSDEDGQIHTYGIKTEADLYNWLNQEYKEPWMR